MYKRLLVVACVCALTVATACSVLSSDRTESENMDHKNGQGDISESLVCVAIYGGTDEETGKIIDQILNQERIIHYKEGSVVYNVLVFEKDADKARALLRDSQLLKNKWYKLIE